MDTDKELYSKFSPLGFGINLAWDHRKFFMQTSIILILADVALYKLASSPQLLSTGQTLLFIPIINLLLISLVFASAAILAITVGRREAVNFRQIIFSAISFLPKIFLSVIAICVLMFFGATFIPLILIFFIWSPFIAAADFYGPDAEKPDNKVRVKALKSEPDDYNPLDALIGLDNEEEEKETGFFNNSMMNLGLLRSAVLSNGNFSAATYSTLIILLVVSLNALFLIGTQFVPDNTAVNYLTHIIASLSISFLAAIAAGSFIVILPEAAKKELKIKNLSEAVKATYKVQTSPKFISTVIFLLIISMASCFYLFKALKQMPEGVEVAVTAAYAEAGEAVIKLNLVDSKRNFTWLTPSAFSIVWDGKNPTSKRADTSGTTTLNIIVPASFSIADSTNQLLQTIPQGTTQITLFMRFPYTQGAKSFELYYSNMFDVDSKRNFITKGSIKP